MTNVQAPWLRLLARDDAPHCWAGLMVRIVPYVPHAPTAPSAPVDSGVAAAAAKRSLASADPVDQAGVPHHFLGAAWPPASGGLARWPEVVVIGSPAPDNALAELFVHVPADAPLYLGSLDELDGAPAAEILCPAAANLEPYPRAGAEALMAAERERRRTVIQAQFTDRNSGFERFRRTLLAGPSSH
ncbi:MAG: hypothetical protein ABI920_19265 [Casimicrobiaceae bacterium]